MTDDGAGARRPGPTRRALLVGGLLVPLLPLAACTADERPAPLPPPDPDVALRAAAVAREQGLLALYDAVLALPPARGGPSRAVLAGVRAEHAVHLAALVPPPAAGSTAPTPLASPSSPVPAVPATPAALRAAEAGAAGAHADAVLPASRGLAALLATLSAAEAAHAVALA